MRASALRRRYGHMAPPFWTEGEFRYGFVPYDCNEPPHVHVEYRESYAKFWINDGHNEPVKIARGIKNKSDEARMLRFVRDNRAAMLEKWIERCGPLEAPQGQ